MVRCALAGYRALGPFPTGAGAGSTAAPRAGQRARTAPIHAEGMLPATVWAPTLART